MSSEAEASLDRTFGLLQIGKARVALPVAAIREVVRGKPLYEALPIKAEGLIGAIDIRGTIVPVLDLRATLGWPDDADDDHVIIVLRSGGHLVGVRAEEVFGIIKVEPGDLCDLTSVGSASCDMLAIQAFESQDGIVTILDPTRIADRPGLPRVVEKLERRDAKIAATASETVLLFSHGICHLGIDADCIDAAVPDAPIHMSAMTTGFCLGTIEHRGYLVPVVDTMAAVGLGMGPRPSTCPVLVIRFGAKTMLGLAVDMVRDIVPVAPDAILAMPALTRGGGSLRGMLLGASEPHHLLLDLDALRRDPELIDLAQLCRPQPRLQVGDAGRLAGSVFQGNAERYITYVAGGELATRLAQITEVLPFPANVAPFASAERAILGLFMHRRRLVPLVCLERVLMGRDRAIDKDTARVLFVEAGDRCAAFVVETLVSIDFADPEHSASRQAQGNAMMGVSFVMLGSGRRMVSHVDLALQIDRVYSAATLAAETDRAEAIVPALASA